MGTSLCPREPALVVATYSGSYGKERAPNKRRQDSNSIGIWDQVYATLEVADGTPRGYSRGRKKGGGIDKSEGGTGRRWERRGIQQRGGAGRGAVTAV